MASRFWVGGTGNTSDTAHWAATTGGAGGETVPVAGDTVNFDSNSGTAATVTVDVALSAASITINKSDLTLLHNAGTTLTGRMTLTTGTLNTNGQTCSWDSLKTSGSTARTLTLGASAISVSATGEGAWDALTSTNLTVTANTATVTLTGTSGWIRGDKNWNGMSVVMTGAGTPIMTGLATYASVTRTGTANKTSGLQINNNFTVTGTLTLGGNTTQGVNRLLVYFNPTGTQATITAAAYVITGDVDFMDINLAYSGGASWTNAGSAFIGDALGNAGAVTTNATVSATQTATGTASFTWSTHGFTTRVPLPQDDVVINNAFVAGRTVTADMPRLGRSIDWTGVSGSPSLDWTTIAHSIYGSYTGTSDVGYTNAVITLTFGGRGSHTFAFGGKSVLSASGVLQIVAPGGTYTSTDGWTNANSSTFSVSRGTFDANNQTFQIGKVQSNSTNTRTISLGNSTWNLTLTGSITPWDLSVTTGLTFSGASAIINITATDSGVTKTFAGGSLTYGTLRHTATGSAALTITGNNTFTNLDLECTTARTITFPAGGTQTVTGTLTLLGAAGQLLSLRSSSTGTKWYINAATTSAQYCDVKDSTATGTGTPINNTTGGVDSGNNIGWLFIAGGPAGYSSTLLTLGVG